MSRGRKGDLRGEIGLLKAGAFTVIESHVSI